MCNGHQINIIRGLAVSHSILHVSSQVRSCNLTLYTSPMPMSFKLLPWDQPKIASSGPVTQLQKVLPCVLITTVSGNRGCIFKSKGQLCVFIVLQKSQGRIFSLNRLTVEFISTEAHGSPKCTTYPLQVDFEASYFIQLPLQLSCADS